tara:strand:+ start:959 stop:1147 length:189 start_codon:yes stop_codon:yes gene_type:complete
MNIVELRDRLTNIIEDNEKRGWGERNESQIADYGISDGQVYWLGLQMMERVLREVKVVRGSA